MVIRQAFRSQIKKGETEQIKSMIRGKKEEIEKLIQKNQMITLSFFADNRNLFLYYEYIDDIDNIDEKIEPHALFFDMIEHLESFAGEEERRYFVPMLDIFHYNRPADVEGWRRKTRPKTSFAQILRLKPDMISSYIYHHYQRQEEKPGNGDKYGIINLHENLMFFYLEIPKVVEKPSYEGKLKTKLSPPNWQEAMKPHFLPWDDGTLWKPIELLLYV